MIVDALRCGAFMCDAFAWCCIAFVNMRFEMRCLFVMKRVCVVWCCAAVCCVDLCCDACACCADLLCVALFLCWFVVVC